MPRLYSGDPDREFEKLRRDGRARLPRDPLRIATDRREMLGTARLGSFAEDVANLDSQISRGRQLLESRGFRDLSQKNLATAGPDTIEAIGDMRRRRTANTVSGGGMGNSQVAWPKFRDPFEQFREKAWWFLKEGEFSQSLKKVREWCNTPDAPILMADGSFKAIGDITVGEKVMGWVWHFQFGRVMQPTTVLATNRREAPMVVEVMLNSGQTMRCTPDHKWANADYVPHLEGMEEYSEVSVGSAVLDIQANLRCEVASITEVGPGEVVSMQTETGNYVAWGIASKNCRLMYMTHPLIPSLIDIYARFPLLDIEFQHQDDRLAAFYNDLFFNELDYQEFLFDMSKEFWTCGEAFALGSWHEGIGAWDDDELINPDDVIVSRNSVLRQYQFHLKVPEGIKKLIETRQPRQEYEMLVKFYPYILQWAQQNREIPVSDVLMKQLKFKCVVGSTPIMTPTGPVLAQDLKVGDEVISWDETSGEFVTSHVSHTGIREPEPIHWVTTKSGRRVGATADHPFWTKNGWVEAADLKPGDEVYAVNDGDSSADWDVVRSVEVGTEENTIALGIAKYHTHVTAGLVTHNTNPWEPHGVPILMRGFKILMLEMSLEAAQDAVADRLYSPLILAKLGIEDIADGEGPWIPEPEELDALRDDLSLALMSDFRLMVYHHGLNIDSVFGREHMPRLDYDFERVDMKLMQIFGIGPELLQGGKSSAPYASGALNRELITQMLSTYQNKIRRFIRDRAAVVAERQGHFEFEKRGGQRFPIYETTLMLDEETGEEYIEERPKLAIPEVSFRTMNLRDEMTERQFLMQLKSAGVPISDGTLMVNIPYEFEDEVLKLEREKSDKVIAELNYQKRLFTSIYLNRLPVPPEYYQAYMQFLSGIQGVALASTGTDITSGSPTPNLFPMSQPTSSDLSNAMMVEQMNMEGVLELPTYRPEISDEQRADMPKKSMRMYASKEEVDEAERIGFDAFVNKLGNINSDDEQESSPRILDVDDEEPLPWHRSTPNEPTEETTARRIDGIKSLASPGHMRLRKKMTLPSTIRYSQASDIEEETPSDSERPLEGTSGLPVDGEDSGE